MSDFDPYRAMSAPGTIGGLLGTPITLSAAAPDGTVTILDPGFGARRILLIGTGPITTREWVRREALRIVQTGLADVLDWLGEPAWQPHPTSADVLDRLQGKAS